MKRQLAIVVATATLLTACTTVQERAERSAEIVTVGSMRTKYGELPRFEFRPPSWQSVKFCGWSSGSPVLGVQKRVEEVWRDDTNFRYCGMGMSSHTLFLGQPLSIDYRDLLDYMDGEYRVGLSYEIGGVTKTAWSPAFTVRRASINSVQPTAARCAGSGG